MASYCAAEYDETVSWPELAIQSNPREPIRRAIVIAGCARAGYLQKAAQERAVLDGFAPDFVARLHGHHRASKPQRTAVLPLEPIGVPAANDGKGARRAVPNAKLSDREGSNLPVWRRGREGLESGAKPSMPARTGPPATKPRRSDEQEALGAGQSRGARPRGISAVPSAALGAA